MAGFRDWDVVRVPFPYTDRTERKFRPALIVSASALQVRHGLVWVAMITSAVNRGWPDDVVVSDLGKAGLPAASVIRPAKIATIDAKDASRLGTLPEADRIAVHAVLSGLLARRPFQGDKA
jgi:mRNA interferase MazF